MAAPTVLSSRLSLSTVVTSVGLTLLLVLPLAVFPFLSDFMITSKLLLLQFAASILGLLAFGTMLRQRMITLHRSPLTIAFIAFGLVVLASSLLSNRYPQEHLLGLGGAWLSFVVITIVGATWIRERSTHLLAYAWFSMVTLLSVATLLQQIGYGPSLLINQLLPLNLPHTGLFNVSGSAFFAAQVFVLGVISGLILLLKERRLQLIALIGASASVVGLILTVWLLLPGKDTSLALPAPLITWNVAVETLKSPRTALIGVGPENYQVAYQLYRPNWAARTDAWNTIYTQATNVPLTLLTTVGMLGFLSWVAIFILASRLALREWSRQPFLASLVVGTFLLQLFSPLNFVILSIQALALAWLMANAQSRSNLLVHFLKVLETTFNHYARPQSALWNITTIVITVVIGGYLLVQLGYAYAASSAYFMANLAASQQKVSISFQEQTRAVERNPYSSLYRGNFALSNVQLAIALASSKEQLSDTEQAQASELIQQGLQQARLLTQLKPDDAQSWILLASIYRRIVPFTGDDRENALRWTVGSYVEAINRYPSNPVLRAELAQFLLTSNRPNDALLLYQQSAQLKPDWAMAYYGMARAQVALEQWEAAVASYQRTLALLDPNSSDYSTIQAELSTASARVNDQGSAKPAENGRSQSTGPTATSSANRANSALPSSELDSVPTATGSANREPLIPSLLNQAVSNPSDAATLNDLNTP